MQDFSDFIWRLQFYWLHCMQCKATVFKYSDGNTLHWWGEIWHGGVD